MGKCPVRPGQPACSSLRLRGQGAFDGADSATVTIQQMGRAMQARIDKGKSVFSRDGARVHAESRERFDEFYIFPHRLARAASQCALRGVRV